MRQILLVIAMSIGMGGFLIAADCTPSQRTTLKQCALGQLPSTWQDALVTVATALVSDNWEAALIGLVAKVGAQEVNCLVQAITSDAKAKLAAQRGEPDPVYVKQSQHGEAWLAKHVTGVDGGAR